MGGFIVPTGNVIKEYLDEREISQKELSRRIGVSERHLSQLLNGKTRLTEDMGLKLEKVMPDVSAGYWLNYDAKYREFVARQRELANFDNLDIKEVAKRFRFKEVFGKTDMSLAEQAVEMLKLLGISDFAHFESSIPGQAIAFMEDGGDREAIIVWLRLCREEIEEQNKDLSDTPYSKDALVQNLGKLKRIASNDNVEASVKSCRKLLNQLGIHLVCQPAIVNARVRGALDTVSGNPAVYISGRFKTHDYIWFTIIHEIAHLLLHYSPNVPLVSSEVSNCKDDRDSEANEFVRKFFIDTDDYNLFLSKQVFSEQSVRLFAGEQKVSPGIVVGFLQHDRQVDFSELNYLKN